MLILFIFKLSYFYLQECSGGSDSIFPCDVHKWTDRERVRGQVGQRGGGHHHHGQEQAETEAGAPGDQTKDFRGWLEKKSVFSHDNNLRSSNVHLVH